MDNNPICSNDEFNEQNEIQDKLNDENNEQTENQDKLDENQNVLEYNQTAYNQYGVSLNSQENLKRIYQYYKCNTENNHPKKVFSKASIILLTSILVLIVIFTSYCIISDILKGSLGPEQFNSGYYVDDENREDLVIKTDSKPEIEEIYTGENGKYTTVGVARAVMPSVVEIFTYNKEISYFEPIGSGSGIIITDDGYIVTNAHVLEDAKEFDVLLQDGTEYTGYLIGKDTKTDIAVIKIDAENLVEATFGNSDEVVIGEQVMAIGNPAGLTGSVTDGIVSGVNRKIQTDATGYKMDCIQTNAAISPGNSGGALVNMYGQVIGITSSKYVNSSYEGLGFAITINEAKPIIEELQSNGYISGRVKIGITFLSSEYAYEEFKDIYGFDMPDDINGLWINQIDESCDISNTELKPYDFIVSVNGKDVYDYDTLFSIIEGKKANDILTAKVIRIEENGERKEFTITFKLMEDRSGLY